MNRVFDKQTGSKKIQGRKISAILQSSSIRYLAHLHDIYEKKGKIGKTEYNNTLKKWKSEAIKRIEGAIGRKLSEGERNRIERTINLIGEEQKRFGMEVRKIYISGRYYIDTRANRLRKINKRLKDKLRKLKKKNESRIGIEESTKIEEEIYKIEDKIEKNDKLIKEYSDEYSETNRKLKRKVDKKYKKIYKNLMNLIYGTSLSIDSYVNKESDAKFEYRLRLLKSRGMGGAASIAKEHYKIMKKKNVKEIKIDMIMNTYDDKKRAIPRRLNKN